MMARLPLCTLDDLLEELAELRRDRARAVPGSPVDVVNERWERDLTGQLEAIEAEA